MAAAPMDLGSSLLQKRAPLLASSSSPSFRGAKHVNLFLPPTLVPSRQGRSCGVKRRGLTATVSAVALTDKFEKAGSDGESAREKAAKFTVRASVTVRKKRKENMKEKVANQLDAFSDKFGRSILLELVSTEIDPRTRKAMTSNTAELRGWFDKKDMKAERAVYTAEFAVDSNFGEPGAILVFNRHQKEFFLETIVVEGFACGPVNFICKSWVQPTRTSPNKRIFFSNKPYLPSETPASMKELRERELKEMRDDDKGSERKIGDRIYDYDVYNDLGNPDKGFEFRRPVLGGQELPYPRRLRTGRPPAETDANCESRVEAPLPVYVPRDEQFEEAKQEVLSEGARKALLHNLIPSLVTSFLPEAHDFKAFHEVDNLFKKGLRLKQTLQDQLLNKVPFLSKIQESSEGLTHYDTPDIITKDKFAWLRDDEFARQALAGINPVNIELITVFPPVSKLDPTVYGPPESAIREEHIVGHLNGMSVQQALEQKKLFMLDYHDVYLPFLDRINAQDGRKAYGTRTVFFLTPQGTLKLVAIELSLPEATHGYKSAKRVLTPPTDATSNWLWQLAKAHVCSNDAGVHQLVNHWLKTHACMEPFIIAVHRQLSAMHPIFKLLKPHMRYTLEINAMARQILINNGGVYETGFTPGAFSMEISAAAYLAHWRFDQEGLPADLIRRGMAVEDQSQPHGLRLTIEDYPYAADGLLLWSAIQNWVQSYVRAYYPDAYSVQTDYELQSWFTEAINVGHADKRHEPWWPRLASPEDLCSVMTTIIWLCSAQHAALNFGQYPLGGYVPNRPPLMRRFLPVEGDPDFDLFVSDPARFFLSALPSVSQATFVSIIDTLSTHSTDEEYLGQRSEPNTWTGDGEMVEAFHEFAAEVSRAEAEITRRNADSDLRNRCGPGVLPYELMAPTSSTGITCRGVPNSVTI